MPLPSIITNENYYRKKYNTGYYAIISLYMTKNDYNKLIKYYSIDLSKTTLYV